MNKIPYFHQESIHNFEAAEEIVPFIIKLTNPKSVVDIGCGLGTWLKVFMDNNITDVLGIDGAYVDRKKLTIPENCFFPQDLTTPLVIKRKYDLAISLEVAEHLPDSISDSFVKSLTQASDVILFSAAIKNQGGENHINEQWYEYWQLKFANHGYKFYDVVRGFYWWNPKVDWWYAQNIFIVSNKEFSALNYPLICGFHPVWVNNKISYLNNVLEGKQGIRFAISLLTKTLLRKFRKR